jgi:dTDP-L-rhamnose 4-epimerase
VKVLVTGGSGFIGSHLVDALVAGGDEVVVVDRRPSPYPNPGARYVVADLAEPATYEPAVAGVEAVSHQAARVGLGRAFGDVVDYAADNDLGTACLLGMLARTDSVRRLVLAGSMVVYGEGAYRCPACGPVRPGPRSAERLAAGEFDPPCPHCGAALAAEAVAETAAVDPRNVYAATKLHQEHLCTVYGRECRVPVISLRYHNVYGPRSPEDTPYAGVASLFLAALRRGEAPVVFEDGRQRRDFVHVADVVRANRAALGAPPGTEGVFNVASGEPRTVLQLAEGLWAALGRPTPPAAVSGHWRMGDVRHIVASPERARRELGFSASVPFAEGVVELAGVGSLRG